MSVPEAAVEAAARALDEHNRPGMWEHESERYKDAFRREARIQLEAAAPRMSPTPPTYSLEDVAAEFGIDLGELRKEEGAK